MLILNINIYAGQNIYNQNYWQKLLHFESGVSMIENIEFFLSDQRNSILFNEFNTTVSLLKSDSGKEIACNYPARYQWLKDQVALPEYNLSECKALQSFLDGIQKDEISLVFSSEYLNSPSSAFGHVLIMFRDFDMPIELADVVHFAAETDNSGFIPYSYKGFTGKYLGYFQREKFFHKIYEYNTLEQRYMYIYTLNFNKQQILSILYHLYELRKASLKYYFLDQNCASKMIDLLDMSNSEKRYGDKSFVLPIDTIKRYQNSFTNDEILVPFIDKIDYSIHEMNVTEREDFQRITQHKEYPNNDQLSDLVKETLVDYSQFQFRKLHKSYKNYDAIMRLTYQPKNLSLYNKSVTQDANPAQVGVGLYKNNDQSSLLLHFRPVLSGLIDMPQNRLQESELSLLEFYMSLGDNNELDQFNILSMKSLPKQTSYYKPLSWQLYLGLNRKNSNQSLEFESKVGLGVTKELFDDLSYSMLCSVGTEVGRDDFALYLEPQISLFYYPIQNVKVGTLYSYKQYLSDNFLYYDIFISTERDNFLYTINYQKDDPSDRVLFQINYNF